MQLELDLWCELEVSDWDMAHRNLDILRHLSRNAVVYKFYRPSSAATFFRWKP